MWHQNPQILYLMEFSVTLHLFCLRCFFLKSLREMNENETVVDMQKHCVFTGSEWHNVTKIKENQL